MKRIKFVKDIHMEDAASEPYFRVPNSEKVTTVAVLSILAPDGKSTVEQKLEPWIFRHYSFLLERTADAACVKDVSDAIEAELFRVELRTALKAQKSEAAERGYWELEDSHATALLNATMKPASPFNVQIAFNFVPFIQAVKNLTTPELDEKAAGKSSNGAAAKRASAGATP